MLHLIRIVSILQLLPVLFLYFAPIDYYFTPITFLSFATLSCEMVLAGGLFDIVSFRIFHVFAHRYYYNHHKVHHEATMNTTALNGNRFLVICQVAAVFIDVWNLDFVIPWVAPAIEK